MSTPDALGLCNGVLSKPVEISQVTYGGPVALQVFEANCDATLRFMVECDIRGANWLRLPGKKYRHRSFDGHLSYCQVFACACSTVRR